MMNDPADDDPVAELDARALAITQELIETPGLLEAVRRLAKRRGATDQVDESPPSATSSQVQPIDFASRLASLTKGLRESQVKVQPGAVASIERRRRELRRVQLASCCARFGVPEHDLLRASVLDDELPLTAALRAARAAIAWHTARGRVGTFCVIAGPCGVGKTVAACHALIRHPDGGQFVTAAAVKTTPRTDWPENRARWNAWLSARVLVFDDLGTEPPDGDPLLIPSLWFERYNRGFVTLVTANLAERDLSPYFAGEIGGRFMDRLLHEQCGMTVKGRNEVVFAPDGLPWYFGCAGQSLRNRDVRAQLLAKGGSR